MEQTFTVKKTAPRRLEIDAGKMGIITIDQRVVYFPDGTEWRIIHDGKSILSGTWRIANASGALVSFSYASSAYQYGEDIPFTNHVENEEYVFQRVSPDEDRWVMLCANGKLLIEAGSSRIATDLPWQIRVLQPMDETVALALVCLLAFDRLACGRYDR